MTIKKPSLEEENAFMDELLSGLDTDDFFGQTPSSPLKTPAKSIHAPPVVRKPLGIASPKTPTRKLPRESLQATPRNALAQNDLDALIEGAEDWDWGDMLSSPVKGENTPVVTANSNYDIETCTRCIVQGISERQQNNQWVKVLTVQLDPGIEIRSVELHGEWATSNVQIGDTINVIGEFKRFSSSSSVHPTYHLVIDSKFNYLIHHPDHLLTATALSSASHCLRKPMLSILLRSTSDVTPALVWGNMLHETMQSCLSTGNWDEKSIDEQIERIARRNVGELFRLGIGVDKACEEVKARAKGVQTFSQRYMKSVPSPDALLKDTRSTNDNPDSLLAITDLLDVEEDIWSPQYGLKGKLDATVQATIAPQPSRLRSNVSTEPEVSSPMPFEIKTGRTLAIMEHRAQTLLYTLLTRQRYKTPIDSGLLYYTQSEEVVRVPQSRNELRALILLRNRLADHISRRMARLSVEDDANPSSQSLSSEPVLPATIDDERLCKRCFVNDACLLYRKAVEGIIDDSSPIAELYDLKTGHLTPSQTTFFKKWERLVSLEEGDIIRFKKELWTIAARERETSGRCFADMEMETSYNVETDTAANGKIHQFTYRFTRIKRSGISPVLSGSMTIGDAVIVSVEPNHLALARGFITELTSHSVVVGVDHELSSRRIRRLVGAEDRGDGDVIFRIDKDDLTAGMGRIRDNLAQLFYVNGDERRRSLIVDLIQPRFGPISEQSDYVASSKFVSHLNDNQREAVTKVLATEDYSLVIGMPGTGKTTVITALIQILVDMGKTVLLTSHTHSAVDNILLKLVESDCGFGILRLGNTDKVHPGVRKLTFSARNAATNIEQLERQLMSPPVVATTCLSIDHPLFSRRTFDYCIVDEASQITLPTCIGPLRSADRFILFGDHDQLPPLVRVPAARKGGLDVSLFRRLSEAYPDATVALTHQYRMNDDIMSLSNELIYKNQLRAGSTEVSNRVLKLLDPCYLRQSHEDHGVTCSDSCWIETLLAESCKAIFVDTDNLPALESRAGDLVQNTTEAILVQQLTEALLQSGISTSQIGIISLYRQQIKVLNHLLENRPGIEILTADRSQGRDKDCVIISMVRSNEDGIVGELVKDWRRINVSFTRARSKLVIFGSRKTLTKEPLLSRFFELMESRKWILRLPSGADAAHASMFPSPQVVNGPPKRSLDEYDTSVKGGDLEGKSPRIKRATGAEGILKGRPILSDLINDMR